GAGEITLEQFKDALENNIECKGYFDSLCDRTVNTRLDKGIESWKEKNLNNLIEEEINIRYPQKSETEIALEKAQEEKRQLELQVKYQNLMVENKLPLELLNFVAG
ncbi:capsid assembly scaffolding protein Gp46 family protein, partial [Clostridium neonatale]